MNPLFLVIFLFTFLFFTWRDFKTLQHTKAKAEKVLFHLLNVMTILLFIAGAANWQVTLPTKWINLYASPWVHTILGKVSYEETRP